MLKRGDFATSKVFNASVKADIDQAIRSRFGGKPANQRARILAYNNTGAAIPPGGLAAIDLTDGTTYNSGDVDPVISLSALTTANLSQVVVVDRQLLDGETGTVTTDGFVVAPVYFGATGDEYATFSATDTIFESSTTATNHRILFIGEDFGTDTQICVVQFNIPGVEKIFRFRQSNSIFLTTGEFFDKTLNIDGVYQFDRAAVIGGGFYEVQLEINGLLTGPIITWTDADTSLSIDMQTPTPTSDWLLGDYMRLKVIGENGGVNQFELTLRASLK